MANEKRIMSRQQQKTDTSANWKKAGEKGFVPLDGEIIVYKDLHKLKVGDGATNVEKLPFAAGGGGGTQFVASITIWEEDD